MPPRRPSTTCSPWGRGLAGRNSALCCSRRSAISHVEVARAGSGTCTFRLSRAPGRTRIHASPVRPDRHVHTSACIINVMHAQWRIQVFLVARKPPPGHDFFKSTSIHNNSYALSMLYKIVYHWWKWQMISTSNGGLMIELRMSVA